MLRDYRMGQRLSGATIGRLLSDYRARTGDYPATIEPAAATIPRLSSDYRKHAARETGRRFGIRNGDSDDLDADSDDRLQDSAPLLSEEPP